VVISLAVDVRSSSAHCLNTTCTTTYVDEDLDFHWIFASFYCATREGGFHLI
jgi:hypothetical protein